MIITGMAHFESVCKKKLVDWYNKNGFADIPVTPPIDLSNVFVVWSCKEKFYFTPGDTGFRVFNTRYGKIGIGICWDQWFPESARCMALQGAELLFYPTAIGSEPILECDSMPHWRRCMQGHAAANLMPVIAANRVGKA